jgi:hypothetical protein
MYLIDNSTYTEGKNINILILTLQTYSLYNNNSNNNNIYLLFFEEIITRSFFFILCVVIINDL